MSRSTPEKGPASIVEFTRAFYLGGTETQVIELLRGLQGRYAVHVGALELQGPLTGALLGLGYRPELFPLRGSFLRANTGKQILRLARWLRQRAARLVHVHDFYATLIAVPAAKLAGCKVVVGRLDLAHWHDGPRRALWTAMTHLADHVITNAQAVRDMLIRDEGLAEERVSIVRNGLELRGFDLRAGLPLEQPLPDVGQAPVIVHVANMNSQVKRQEDLLEALALLRGSGLAAHAFLVGDGPRRPQLEALARKLEIQDRAHFLGHRTDVPAVYARASIGVLCSSAEGLSNAIIEGMASRLPMVVTRAGGNAELVSDGERGLVVPACRPPALAMALRRLITDDALSRKLGTEARAHVERELGAARMVDDHDRVYRRVLAS